MYVTYKTKVDEGFSENHGQCLLFYALKISFLKSVTQRLKKE